MFHKRKMKKNNILVLTLVTAVLIGGCTNGGNPKVTPTPDVIPITGPVQNVNEEPTPIIFSEPTLTPTPTSGPTGTPTPTYTPTPSPIPEITITMVGDILIHDRIEQDCLMDDGTYDYTAIFKNTKDLISSYDIAIVNQEIVIGGKELGISGYPEFNASYELADALADAGFDIVLHATNHVLDRGVQGIYNTLNNWKRFPQIKVLGMYESQEDHDNNQIVYYEKDGIKLAILNFTYGWNGNGSKMKDAPWVVGPRDDNPDKEEYAADAEEIIRLLDEAEANADFTIVCPHWGSQYDLSANSTQKKWCRIFYDHGVDLVLGDHPHVIQPIIIVDSETTFNVKKTKFTSRGDRSVRDDEMLVIYSVGNFVNWTGESGDRIPERMVGGMPDITLGYDENGKVVIKDFSMTTVVSHVETGKQAVTVYKLSDYTEELAARNEIQKQTKTPFTKEYCENLCNELWGNYWK